MRLLHLPCFAAQYHRLMAPDPPEHPARPPYNTRPVQARNDTRSLGYE